MAARASSLVNSWETIRCELLNTRIADLGLTVHHSPIEPHIHRLYRELAAKGMQFKPAFYLTNSWGCPDEVPIIGVPFYLADKRLARIEEEQTGEIEDGVMIQMLLRHEAGHAINYAYRLWEDPEWIEVFGHFYKAYRDTFRPNEFTRQFVRHIAISQYGRTYAQKHPDEDFAETFAVWLAPGSNWRRKYRFWPALAKLKYVDRLMRKIGRKEPVRTGGKEETPVDEMNLLLAEHYGQRVERYRAYAQGYVDDKLREVFPPSQARITTPAQTLIQKHEQELIDRITRWSELEEKEVRAIVSKLSDRAAALNLIYSPRELNAKLVDLTALATTLAMDFSYTGRFFG